MRIPPFVAHSRRPSGGLWSLGALLFAGCIGSSSATLTADDLLDRGLAKLAQKDYAGTLADCDRALALAPNRAVLHYTRGIAEFHLRRYDDAIDEFDRTVELDPTDTDAFYGRALSKRREHDFDGAFADYDHAIELDSDYWQAYNGRATTHNAHGDYALAIADYEKRIALEPEGSEYAWFQRSLLLRRLGRADTTGLAAHVDGWPDGWPKTLGQFLLGRIGPDELLRLADVAADAQTRREQRCEADYYVGITALLAGRSDEAREKFTDCLGTGVSDFLEATLSRAELGRMGVAVADP